MITDRVHQDHNIYAYGHVLMTFTLYNNINYNIKQLHWLDKEHIIPGML